MQKLKFISLALLLFVVCIGFAGCAQKAGQDKAVNANQDKQVISVKIAEVTTGTIQDNAVISGKLEALRSADVVAKSTGKVAGISVDVGSVVAAGQTLITLEADDLKAAVDVAAAGVDSARITYDMALKQYARGNELVQTGAISQSDYENNYEGAYKKAEVGLKSASAALVQSRVRYNESIIKSPLRGVVTARNIEVGELAGTNTPLVTVVNLDKVVLAVNVSEDQINRLSRGQQVQVKVAAVDEKPFSGIISNIALAANQNDKAFPVKIEIDNRKHLIKPGMFAEALFSWEEEKGLVIPREAVVATAKGSKVFLIADGVAREREVKTGASDGAKFLVTSGLSAGDKVAVTSLQSLADGAGVKVAE